LSLGVEVEQMDGGRIVLGEKDYVVLRHLAEMLPKPLQLRYEHYGRFVREIGDALVTDSPEVTNAVITLRSRVTYTDVNSGISGHAVVVFPAEVKNAPENVSILSPFGMALIGEREGAVVEYVAPGGRYRVRMDKVEQPVVPSSAAQTS
jgi:regulator of nucleoside diphosphate kinase